MAPKSQERVVPPGGAPDAQGSAARGGVIVAHYNDVRLHSALDYVTLADKLAGLQPAEGETTTPKLANSTITKFLFRLDQDMMTILRIACFGRDST